MIDGWNLFNHPMKNDIRAYEIIQKVAASQGGSYTNGGLLDYPSFNELKLIVII